MLDFSVKYPQTELTPHQAHLLQRKEARLGSLIYYSPYRDELRHLIFDYERWKMNQPFDDLNRVLDERIHHVSNYHGRNEKKRTSEHEAAPVLDDEQAEFSKRCCQRPSR